MTIDIGIGTATQYDGKHLEGQVDGYGGEAAGVPFGDVHMIAGVLHRSSDPELDADGTPIPDKSAARFYWWEGGRLHQIPADDPRIIAKLPPLKKGSTMIACATGAFIQLDGESGTVQVYVPKDGSAHVAEFTAGGAITVRSAQGAGLVLDGSKALIHSGGGSSFIELRDDGITLSGNVKVQGALAGPIPAPVPVLNATLTPATFLTGF